MVFCFIVLAVMFILTIVSTLDSLEKVVAVMLISLLAIGIPVMAAFRLERGAENTLKNVGYRQYTKTELYEMSEKEKSKLIKTYDGWEGTKYWVIDEQSTK